MTHEDRNPFSKIAINGTILKRATTKKGRQMVFGFNELTDEHLGDLEDLVSYETNVLIVIEADRRGELFMSKRPEVRVQASDHVTVESAIGELILEGGGAVYDRMIEKLNGGTVGWDDAKCIAEYKKRIASCVKRGDWLDAAAWAIILRNLEKKTQGEIHPGKEEPTGPTLFDGNATAAEPPDYSKMKIKDLMELCTKREIVFHSATKKPALVNRLMCADLITARQYGDVSAKDLRVLCIKRNLPAGGQNTKPAMIVNLTEADEADDASVVE